MTGAGPAAGPSGPSGPSSPSGPSGHPLDLAGKVAIVTGGNRGIGFGMARGLAAAGCRVAIWARDEAQNARAVEACQGLPGAVAAWRCDVLQQPSIDGALAATLERFGHVDGLFANAGIGGGGRTAFVEQSDEDWQRMFDVNVMATRRVAASVLRQMVRQVQDGRRPGGRVVLTASIAARMGTALNQHYAGSKAAVVALARGLAMEFARYGITANAVLPGYVSTGMIGELMENDRFNERVLSRLAVRRYGDPAEFGGIAVYLMSDLSAYHTGDAIVIDGGLSIS